MFQDIVNYLKGISMDENKINSKWLWIVYLFISIVLIIFQSPAAANHKSIIPSEKQGQDGQDGQGAGKQRLLSLVVGIDEFEDRRIRNLEYCRSDALAVAGLLSSPEYTPYDSRQVTTLVNEQASKSRVRSALQDLAARAAEQDTVMIYFSSHGVQQDRGTGYWILHNTRVDEKAYSKNELRVRPKTALKQAEIKSILDSIRAKRLLVLVDCCFSAATVISTPRGEDFASEKVQDPFQGFQGQGRVVITASEGEQRAAELSELGHGAFTYYLVQGLRGQADENWDNVVELWEMWRYLKDKVTAAARKMGNQQRPTISSTHLTHGFPLSTYPLQIDAGEPRDNPQNLVDWVPVGRTGQGRVLISATEISNRQYLAFVRENPAWRKDRIKSRYQDGDYLSHWPSWNEYPAGTGEHPVTRVSWFAAKAFAEWIGGKLPSEEHWLMASLGRDYIKGTSPEKNYPWGGTWRPDYCNSRAGQGGSTMPVQSLAQGAIIRAQGKIFHLSGNVWEWCRDMAFAYENSQGQKSIVVRPVSREQRVEVKRLIKGGSFMAGRLGCMLRSRVLADPKLCAPDGGFRVVKVGG